MKAETAIPMTDERDKHVKAWAAICLMESIVTKLSLLNDEISAEPAEACPNADPPTPSLEGVISMIPEIMEDKEKKLSGLIDSIRGKLF